MEKLGYLDEVKRHLAGLKAEIFNEIKGEPSINELKRLASKVRERKSMI